MIKKKKNHNKRYKLIASSCLYAKSKGVRKYSVELDVSDAPI